MQIPECERRGNIPLLSRQNTVNGVTLTKVTPEYWKGDDDAVSDGTPRQKFTHSQAPGIERPTSITQQYRNTAARTYRSVGMMASSRTSPYHPSPRKTLIQGVVLTQTNKAFRSHRLFPLLKDLAITDHYYGKAAFSVGE